MRFVFLKKTRRDRLKSAQYLRLKNIQRTTIGNIWKIFFFENFFRKSHNAEKLKKRPFRLIKRFYKPKTSKKMQGGYPLIESENFRKKSLSAEKKTKKIKRKKTFGLASTFGSIKNLWFSARIEPTICGFSES